MKLLEENEMTLNDTEGTISFRLLERRIIKVKKNTNSALINCIISKKCGLE